MGLRRQIASEAREPDLSGSTTRGIPSVDHVDVLLRLARGLELRDELGEAFGTYCHQFRNRLNSIKLAIYLAKRQATEGLEATWQELEQEYLAIEDQLDRVQMVSRDANLAPVAIDLNLLFEDRARRWTGTMRLSGIELDLSPPERTCPTRVDIARFAFGLDELVSWRATANTGPRVVRIEWGRNDDRTTVRWLEGLGESTSDAGEGADPGRTWALPILARLMADHRGTLSMSRGSNWELILEWPAESPVIRELDGAGSAVYPKQRIGV